MLNLMVANISSHNRYSKELTVPMIKAQIENSLELGWKSGDICLISNFDFEYSDVKAINVKLNSQCLTGSKMFALHWLLNPPKLSILRGCSLFPDLSNLERFPIFAHDLDAWQNYTFEVDFGDVGISTYSSSKFNGGVVFWRLSAKDIIDEIVDTLINGEQKEEPTINKLLTSTYKDRTTILNSTFNVGCSGFVERLTRAEKPIKIVHLNPYNRIAWETHMLDRNGIAEVSVCPRLEKILRKYFPFLATELSDEGRNRRLELIHNPKSKHSKKKTPKTKKPGKSISRKIDNAFYARDIRTDRQHTYKSIVDCCMNLFPATRSVIDFGCGSAWMLYYFMRDYSCEIKGIEPNELAKVYMSAEVRDFIDIQDLRDPLRLWKKFDLALCLEVVEHIIDSYSDTVISNITKGAPILVFSAASPGQGGSEHVNERFFEYWMEKLLLANFEFCPVLTLAAKNFLKEARIKSWYANNISIFKFSLACPFNEKIEAQENALSCLL